MLPARRMHKLERSCANTLMPAVASAGMLNHAVLLLD